MMMVMMQYRSCHFFNSTGANVKGNMDYPKYTEQNVSFLTIQRIKNTGNRKLNKIPVRFNKPYGYPELRTCLSQYNRNKRPTEYKGYRF